MTRNADGLIVLSAADEGRFSLLFASLDQHVRYSQIYTLPDISTLIRDWREFHSENSHAA